MLQVPKMHSSNSAPGDLFTAPSAGSNSVPTVPGEAHIPGADQPPDAPKPPESQRCGALLQARIAAIMGVETPR